MPRGPPNLWAAMVIVAAPRSLKFSGSLPAAWAASVWSGMLCSLQILANFGDGLEDARFVVGDHGGDETRVRLLQVQ